MRTQSSAENLSPQIVGSIAKELKKLSTAPPDGIKYVPRSDSFTEIYADIEGPEGTPYHGGSFQVKLVLGEDYPSAPPRGFFLTKIYHPNVSTAGEICVNTLKRDWKPDTGICHVLQVIRCLLIVPFPESSLNDEAGKLFMESYDEYAKRAKVMTEIHAGGGSAGGSAGAGGKAGAGAAGEGGGAGAPAPKKKPATVVDKKKKKRAAEKKKSLRRL